MEWLKPLIDWLKQPPRVVAAAAALCAFLLFTPKIITDTFKVTKFRDQFEAYIGFFLLLCIALLCVHILAIVFSTVRKKWYNFRVKRIRIQKLCELTEEECDILRYYIKNQTKTQSLSISCGVTAGLEADKIIARSTTLGGTAFDFNIQPWAWKYLNEHPKVIGLKKEAPIKHLNRRLS
jgi:hypothetical protein